MTPTPIPGLANAAMSRALDALKNGVREEGTSNWGPVVSQYLKAAGITEPAPWCMAFVHWCVELAAQDLHVADPLAQDPGKASVQMTYEYAKENSLLVPATQARWGDIAFFCFDRANPEHHDHTGFVYQAPTFSNGRVIRLWSLDGNTNDTGGREGFKVAIRQRNLDMDRVHFARIGT